MLQIVQTTLSTITYYDNITAAAPEETTFYVFYYGLLFSITCVNLIGNFLVIVTVLRHENLRQPCNYFLVSMAVSDWIFGLFYPVYNIGHMQVAAVEETLGTWDSCRVVVTVVMGLEICSAYHLVAVTANRYVAIMKPLRYHIHVTRQRAVKIMVSIWSVSFSAAILVYSLNKPDSYKVCQYEKIYNAGHAAVLSIFTVIIPLVIMITLYSSIVRIARKQIRNIVIYCPGRSDNFYRGHIVRREMKSTMLVAVLVGCFAVAWTPMCIYLFVCIICGEVNKYIRACVRLLVCSNYAINIFIYAGRLREFRACLRKDFLACLRLHNTN